MSISGTMHTSPRLAFVGCESSAGASAGAGAAVRALRRRRAAAKSS